MTASFNLLKGFSSSVRKPSISLKIMFPDPEPPGQRGKMMKIFVTRKRFHIAAFLTAGITVHRAAAAGSLVASTGFTGPSSKLTDRRLATPANRAPGHFVPANRSSATCGGDVCSQSGCRMDEVDESGESGGCRAACCNLLKNVPAAPSPAQPSPARRRAALRFLPSPRLPLTLPLPCCCL